MSRFLVSVDLSGGEARVEPAGLALDDRDLLLVMDARLDNRRELIDALELSGMPGNGELILAAYRKWGERCPERLLGDFAFVLWDSGNRRLFGARDPLGVRPLYWTRSGRRLSLASAASLLLSLPEVPRRVDPVTVGEYLARLPSEPERTFFQDVRRLPGGHTLTATREDLRIARYWDPANLSSLDLGEDEAAGRFRELFRQSVRDRLEPGEGPVGVAMSGGLDSTSVAAVAAAENVPLLACSFVFDRLSECDERRFIQTAAGSLGIETAFIDAERLWLLKDAGRRAPCPDSPVIAWESAFQRMLDVLRERGGRALLTGHGADDLLGGSRLVYADRLRRGDLRAVREVWDYSRSRRYGWRPLYHLLAEPLLGAPLAGLLRRAFGARREAGIPRWIAPEFAHRTGLAERYARARHEPSRRTARDAMHERLVHRPSYHAALEWYEQRSAAHGIEVRHPFLDRRLLEFVLSLPPQRLVRLGERKTLLCGSLSGILPDEVRLRRRKVNLGSFVDFSLRRETDRVRDLLANPVTAELGIVDGEQLRRAFERYRSNGAPDADQRSIWYAITLELWFSYYLFSFEGTPYEASPSTNRRAA